MNWLGPNREELESSFNGLGPNENELESSFNGHGISMEKFEAPLKGLGPNGEYLDRSTAWESPNAHEDFSASLPAINKNRLNRFFF